MPGDSPFARALAGYGLGRCGQSGAALLIGLGEGSFQAPSFVRRLSAVPDRPEDIHFLDAPNQVGLIAALMASPEAAALVDLHIGSSLDVVAAGRFDYREAVAALNGACLPALSHLELGGMFLTFNGHPYFGQLGDVAHIFDTAPALTELDLYGTFGLSRPVSHATLCRFSAQIDEIGVTGGPPTQDPVTRLLTSTFPALVELDLDLDGGSPDLSFALPESFPDPVSMPALRRVAVTNLAPGDDARLAAWRDRHA